jgi:SPP1 gp7 family putative phage head morphogenesis protein
MMSTKEDSYENPININLLIERSVKRIAKKKLKKGQADADLVEANYQKLLEGLNNGFVGKLESVEFGSAAHRMYLNMRYNVFVTSAFKNYHNTLEMLQQLFDENGNLRTFEQFRKEAKKIAETYNKNYLQAEWQTAQASARMGSLWHKFKARGGKLRYVIIKDDRVRDEHRVLSDVTYPVDHVFWFTYYPPNGYRCRCYVIWVADDTATVEAKELPTIPKMFQNNVGISGQAFTEDSPYFENTGSFNPEKVKGVKRPLNPAEFDYNIKRYSDLIVDPNHTLEMVDNLTGGFVFKNLKADKRDLALNLRVSKKLATSEGLAVEIAEHTEGVKNPELIVQGIKSDIKTPEVSTTTAINSAFKNAKKQGVNTLILNIEVTMTIETLAQGIERGFRNQAQIRSIWVLFQGKTFNVDYSDYQKGLVAIRIKEALK